MPGTTLGWLRIKMLMFLITLFFRAMNYFQMFSIFAHFQFSLELRFLHPNSEGYGSIHFSCPQFHDQNQVS